MHGGLLLACTQDGQPIPACIALACNSSQQVDSPECGAARMSNTRAMTMFPVHEAQAVVFVLMTSAHDDGHMRERTCRPLP
jgi:hypothetical protein